MWHEVFVGDTRVINFTNDGIVDFIILLPGFSVITEDALLTFVGHV